MKAWGTYCKITNALVKFGAVIGIIAVCCTAVLVTVDVILRGTINKSTMIADEYACYFCVAMTFFGGALAYREGSFISVDVLYSKFKPGFKKWLDLVLNLISIAFVIYLMSKVFYIASYSFEGDVRSATISRTPLFIPQGAMFAGMIIFLMQLIISTFDPFITGGANLVKPTGEAVPDESEFERLGDMIVADNTDNEEGGDSK